MSSCDRLGPRMNLDQRIRELIAELSAGPARPTPRSLLDPIAREVEAHLDRCLFDTAHYVRHPIHLGADWEVMLIAWESGQKTPIHDHRGSMGSMAVFSGSLVEERFDTPGQKPDLIDRTTRGSGDVSETGPEVLHRLFPGKGRAISLHVYRPPLREMGIWEASGMTEIRPSTFDVGPEVLAALTCR
jgi:hypothetical protein